MMPARINDTRLTLDRLIGDLCDGPVPPIAVADVAMDSRQVTPGALFLAVRGHGGHGLEFASDAVAAGAAAIAWEPHEDVRVPRVADSVALVPVPDLRRHAGRVADRFFAEPSAAMRIAGITGTNGKTTVAHLLAGAATADGLAAASMGTVGIGRPGSVRYQSLTTPDAVSVHRSLRALADDAVRYLAMEVSSHALDQHRVGAVRFDTAVFTNLTRDHLDYHGSEADYLAAKRKLFEVPGLRRAVVNVGDATGAVMLDACAGAVDRIAVVPPGATPPEATRYVEATHVDATPGGLTIDVRSSWGDTRVETPLLGAFNAVNALSALAVLLGWDIPLAKAARALAGVGAPPGRMETFGDPRRGPVMVVDYAHTPDALRNALAALREHAGGTLWCVFGCGGERDRGKRPMMGAVAAELADRCVVTDDNPRGEDPDRIVRDILGGVPTGTEVDVVRDRHAAIERSYHAAGPGDIVLVAGKGHEDYQEVGDTRRPFSDRQVAAELAGMDA